MAGEMNKGRTHPPDCLHCEAVRRKPKEAATYNAVHIRARKLLLGNLCAHSDETCKGATTSALSHETPTDRIRTQDERGRAILWSPIETDYIPLCISHHWRYDGVGLRAVRQER
jgi:hypothetical protein